MTVEPKLGKTLALLKVYAVFKAAVPVAWLAKLKVSVSHVFAVVTVASVSTDLVGSEASSSFMRTGTLATPE